MSIPRNLPSPLQALCTDKNGRRIMSLGRKRRDIGSATILDSGAGKPIWGQVRVQSGFDVVDSRSIPVLSGDKSGAKANSFMVSSKVQHSIDSPPMTPNVESSQQMVKSNAQWPIIITCAVIMVVVCALVAAICYVRKRSKEGWRGRIRRGSI